MTTETLTEPSAPSASNTNLLSLFDDDFDAAGRRAGRLSAAPALQELRSHAVDRIQVEGLPTTGDEEFRFTSLAPLSRQRFSPAERSGQAGAHPRLDALSKLTAHKLVFVNGFYEAALSSLPSSPGLSVSTLVEAAERGESAVADHLGQIARQEGAPFAVLNTAFAGDGVFFRVDRSAVIEEPIHVLFLTTSPSAATAMFPRLLVVAGENSQVTILETHAGIDGEVYFSSAVSEFVLGENAVVDHYRLEDESMSAFHFSAVDAVQAATSHFSTTSLNFGGALVRNDVGIVLKGEGCNSTMNGLVRIAGRQLVDNHTRIDHALPHCESQEFYKTILDDQSRGVFNGKIMVREDAQKTNALQTNKNLLLSKEALINTNPQLEIFADDVKCTHGATIGQLEDKYVYYLRSRGIPLDEARNLLIFAFANDVVQRVKVDSLREMLEKRLLDVQAEAARRHANVIR